MTETNSAETRRVDRNCLEGFDAARRARNGAATRNSS